MRIFNGMIISVFITDQNNIIIYKPASHCNEQLLYVFSAPRGRTTTPIGLT